MIDDSRFRSTPAALGRAAGAEREEGAPGASSARAVPPAWAQAPLEHCRRQLDAAVAPALAQPGAVDDLLAWIDAARREADVSLARATRLSSSSPAAALGPPDVSPGPQPQPRYVLHQVTLCSGVGFSAAIDPEAEDPLSVALGEGCTGDDILLGLMLQVVQPDDRVLDLGAQVGTFALAASSAGCEVLAVEASPDKAALLRAAARHNGFCRLHVVQAGVGDWAATVEFGPRGPRNRSTGAALSSRAIPVPALAVDAPVPALAVDALLAELGWDTVSFVRMNLGGGDLPALAGMRRLLERDDAAPVLFEADGPALATTGGTPEKLLAEFEALGFATYMIAGNRLVRVRSADGQPQAVADYLAVKGCPPGLDGWLVRRGMPRAERAARIATEARNPDPVARRWVGGMLAAAPADLLAEMDVTGALEALCRDQLEEVRASVAWWSPRPAERPERA